ncbi:MAG: hypothetical protein L0229_00565 [Blastocatellia bacterium]|nr:hypothetical protein [Blastocatellia bacterium]
MNILTIAAGEVFEGDFMGEGEIFVRREGHSRIRHIFTLNGRVIGQLRWRGLRRAVYETEGIRFDINIKKLDKCISITSEDGSESFLVERSRANPHRAGMRVKMAEGDDFRLLRSCGSRFKSEVSFSVNKPFYASTLLVFHFNTRQRSQTTVRINVEPAMKWEARFTHRLLALVVCRIILERRHSGSPPVRIKESMHCSPGDGRSRSGASRVKR